MDWAAWAAHHALMGLADASISTGEPQGPMSHLHQDLGLIIASHLPQEELRCLREVSRDWSATASAAVHHLQPRAPLNTVLAQR